MGEQSGESAAGPDPSLDSLVPAADAEVRPEELKVVVDFRRVARELAQRAADGRLPPCGEHGWPLAAVELADLIRSEPEPVRGWAEAAVWQELRSLYGDDPETGFRRPPPPSYVMPLRRLAAEGNEVCPACGRPIPTLEEFEEWDRLELDAAKRRDTHRGATTR